METTRALRTKARSLEPTAQIGKSGLTLHVIHHIQDQLNARKMVKIKVLPSAFNGDRRDFARALAVTLEAKLVDVIGHVVVLQKEGE